MDGGLADNLGLRYLVGTVLNYGDNHDALRRAGRDHVRRIVLLSVDAGTSPIGAGGSYAYRIDPRWQQERFIPPNDALLSALFGTEITNYNSGTMALVNKKLDETVKELRRLRCEESSLIDGYSCGDVQDYFVHLALSDAPDPQMREQLLQIPTALTVPDEAVDRLVATGETLVRDSTILAEMRRSLEALP